MPHSAPPPRPDIPDRPATRRYALTLDLQEDPELIAQYKRVHSPEGGWPEIAAGIRAVGILDMEIYLEGTRLFMLMETPADFAFDTQMRLLATLPRQAEWEAFVSRFQRSRPDASSAEKWRPMERIFTLPGSRSTSAPALCPREA